MRVIALVVGLGFAAAAVEALVRVLDGDRVFAVRLVQARGGSAPPIVEAPGALTHRYVSALPVADGVRREWFDRAPDPLPRPPLSPELAVVARQVSSTVSSEMFKQWNTRLIQDRVCSGDPFFSRFPGFAFSFQPSEPTAHPPYRYLSSVATPYGLVTNQFGFRGHEIAADKPAGVIRVAVVGASTAVGSHSQAFSYPEFLEPWLNLWAQQEAPGVRVEVINAGREGIMSTDIAAIVRLEVMPLEPDVILYHEGGNQFSFRNLIEEAGEPIVVPAALSANSRVPGVDRFALMRRLDVAVRRIGMGSGAEPHKPRYTLKWPASVDERHPDPDAPALPLDLPRVVRDLDDIRRSAEVGGAELALTSFIWMVKDGLVVDPVNDAYYFKMLNLAHWPARYADILRMADFQNRVLRAYADVRHVPFLDVSAQFPREMALFGDPVHMTLDGDRLRAWIMFQGLVPMLRAGIAAHRLPRAGRAPLHAAAAAVPLTRDPLTCTDFSSFTAVPQAAPLATLHASDASATVSGGSPRRVVTPASQYGYAAELPIAETARIAGPGMVYVRIHVISGSVTIGVLKKDRSGFLLYGTLAAGPKAVEMRLPLPSMSDAGFLMITNAVGQPGQRSIADVEETAVFVPGRR